MYIDVPPQRVCPHTGRPSGAVPRSPVPVPV